MLKTNSTSIQFIIEVREYYILLEGIRSTGTNGKGLMTARLQSK